MFVDVASRVVKTVDAQGIEGSTGQVECAQ
jgi:hypothetical protein